MSDATSAKEHLLLEAFRRLDERTQDALLLVARSAARGERERTGTMALEDLIEVQPDPGDERGSGRSRVQGEIPDEMLTTLVAAKDRTVETDVRDEGPVRTVFLPILGESPDRRIEVVATLVPENASVLIVSDSAMAPGLQPGDHAVVAHTDRFSSNDLVVAVVDDALVVRRFVEDARGVVRLAADDPAYGEIALPDERRDHLIGVVVEVLQPSEIEP